MIIQSEKINQEIENSLYEEIIRKYKILDEKCEEVLKKIRKRKNSK
jgi:hypothetical protein